MTTAYSTTPTDEELSTAVTILPMDYSFPQHSVAQSALPLYHMSPPPNAQADQAAPNAEEYDSRAAHPIAVTCGLQSNHLMQYAELGAAIASSEAESNSRKRSRAKESDEDSRFLTPSIVIQDQASFIDGSVSTAGDIYPLLQGADIMAQGVDSPSTIMQSLKWQAFMPETWFILLCGSTLQEIHPDEFDYQVEADKGFNFSTLDNSFVCQKKNHFQVTVQMRLPGLSNYLIKKKNGGIEAIRAFGIHLYGVKLEALSTTIDIEQSKTDRTKTPYEPIMLDPTSLPDQIIKATASRLHFSETTANNMRKRGKPNPDQRYFTLVVAVHAYTMTGTYPVIAHTSERIIVRASNPANFDNDIDVPWTRGTESDVICHHGKVGINTDSPCEALTVNGNVQVTGQILQPSDMRLKENFQKRSTKQMLENVSKLTLYSYNFKEGALASAFSGMLPEWKEGEAADHGKAGERIEVGMLAQEVEAILPDAVHTCSKSNREVLLLSKERVMMECIGAVQELIKMQKQMNYHNNHVLTTLLVLCAALLIVLILA